MTLPVFPRATPPSAPYSWGLGRPIVSGGPPWAPKTRRLTARELASVELSFKSLSWSEASPIIEFWNTVDGGNGVFSFIDFHQNDDGTLIVWPVLYVGAGDGILTSWTMPTAGCIAGTVTKNGTPVTTSIVTSLPGSPSATTAYVIHTSGATLDTLHYESAADADLLRIEDAQCYRAMPRARFGTQKLPLSTDEPLLVSIGPLPIFEVI